MVATWTGKDGAKIHLLDNTAFNKLVKDYLESGADPPWYLQEKAQMVYRRTGIGYYPNGITIGKNIYLRYKYRGDWELVAHEYGHTLGMGHTGNYSPSVMNAVSQMRVTDPQNLKERARSNFPEYFSKFVIPREAYQNVMIGGAAALFALAWLG